MLERIPLQPSPVAPEQHSLVCGASHSVNAATEFCSGKIIRYYIHLGSFVTLAFALMGCGPGGVGAVSCSATQQSKTWLLGEVDQKIEDKTEGAFAFPFSNSTSQPVQIRVRSIGCSCYAIRRGETRLKVGDVFELGAGQTQTLTLHPPRPTNDRASDYQFSVEYELAPAAPKQVISCQGTLVTIAEYRINPGLISAEFVKDSPPQAVRLEITRTAREARDADLPPVMTGWPVGVQSEEPVALGPVSEVPASKPGEQLWRKSWRLSAMITRPELTAVGREDFRTLTVTGAEPGSPKAAVKLALRYRSGLSGPRIVHFGDVPAGQLVTRRIQILARDDQPFRIIGPSAEGLALSIEPESDAPVKSHWGNLMFAPSETGDFRHLLEIATDHPEQPTLLVEVRAHVIPD